LMFFSVASVSLSVIAMACKLKSEEWRNNVHSELCPLQSGHLRPVSGGLWEEVRELLHHPGLLHRSWMFHDSGLIWQVAVVLLHPLKQTAAVVADTAATLF
jgi:hypothetical protein